MKLDVNNEPIKYCKYCEKQLPLNNRTKYCNKSCSRGYEKIIYAMRYKKKIVVKTCQICGDILDNNHQVYCQICVKRFRKIYDRKRNLIKSHIISEETKKRQVYLNNLSDEEFYEEVTKKMMEKK